MDLNAVYCLCLEHLLMSKYLGKYRGNGLWYRAVWMAFQIWFLDLFLRFRHPNSRRPVVWMGTWRWCDGIQELWVPTSRLGLGNDAVQFCLSVRTFWKNLLCSSEGRRAEFVIGSFNFCLELFIVLEGSLMIAAVVYVYGLSVFTIEAHCTVTVWNFLCWI